MTRRADPQSVRQLARQHGLRASTVTERLRRGWTLDQALGTPAAERHGKRTGLAEAARNAQIGRTTVRKRLKLGWTLEEALHTPVGQTRARK